MAIWFYDESLSIDIRRTMEIALSKTFKCLRPFTDKEKFKAFLNGRFIIQILTFIISGEQAEDLCRRVKEKSRKYDVYELNINLTQSIRKNSNTWFTFSSIKELFKTITESLRRSHDTVDENGGTSDEVEHTYQRFLPPLGIFDSLLEPKLFYCLSKESSTFLLFQLLNRIIIEMTYTSDDLKTMCVLCREKYQTNAIEMGKITRFQKNYCAEQAIEYYTKASFLFRLLNEVLRREDISGIKKFGCYIADLHKQLEEKSTSSTNKITLYRGKKLPLIVLQQLKDIFKSKDVKDKLISMNGFLSITKKKKVAKVFAGIGGTRDGYESVMFRMHIDRAITNRVPYAYIADTDSRIPDEKEILFSMGSVWQLTSVRRKKAAVWTIVLRLCNVFDDRLTELDQQLLVGQFSNDYHVFLLAKILHKLGKYSQAGEFYYGLVDKDLPEEFKSLIHFNFATMKSEQGEYTEAQEHLAKTITLNKSRRTSRSLRPIYANMDAPSQLTILNNMGVLYQKIDCYDKARNSFKEALKKEGSPKEKAIVYNNLGNLENLSGNLTEAHQHLEEAVKLSENSVWSNKFKKDLENVKQQLN
jgi:tetratricopeptide (TPR) repeat protein